MAAATKTVSTLVQASILVHAILDIHHRVPHAQLLITVPPIMAAATKTVNILALELIHVRATLVILPLEIIAPL